MNRQHKLKVGLLTHSRNWQKYESKQLIEAIENSGNEIVRIDPFKDILPPNGKENLDVLISRAQVTNTKTLQAYLRFLEYYEKMCPVLNDSHSLITCQDKYRTYVTLKEHNIPTPETYLTYNKDKAIELLSVLDMPVVFKWIWKGGGNGVVKFDTYEEAIKHIEDLAEDRKPIYMQKYLKKNGNRDIRAQVVGKKVPASVYRVNNNGGWVTNIYKGATPVKAHLSKTLEKLAVDSARAVNADVAGVDIAETDNGPYVIEVNITPSYGPDIDSINGVNVSEMIVDYACKMAERKKNMK